MKEYDQKFMIVPGLAQDVLKTIPDNTFQTIVTSPPYWKLRDYFSDGQLGQEETPEKYVENLVSILREARRTLRKDGTLWLNIGDCYNSSSGYSRASKGFKRKSRAKGSAERKFLKHPHVKRKEMFGIPWMAAFALQKDGWYLRMDVIWCLSGGTEVYAKSKDKEFPISIKDLYRLDPSTIKLWNGEKWTQMLRMVRNPQKHNEIQFTLRNGERICCTPNHVWPTLRGNVATRDLIVGDVLKTCSLPEPEVCSNPDLLPDNDIGWFVGIYLAEGSKSGKTIQISSNISENNRYQRLKSIAEKYQGTCHRYKTSDNGMTINIHSNILNSIIDMYIGGRIAKNKHLSSLCWQRNNIFLRNVLEGYLEGDGHYDKKNDRYRLGFTRGYNLENSLRTICARLGISCTIKLANSKIKEKIYKTFRGEIRFKKSNHFNCKNSSEIVKIEKDKGGRNYFYDIEVADEPNLFALSSGILTHNSKSNPMPDGAKDRPTKGHEYLFLLSKSARYYYDYYATLEDTHEKPEQIQGFGAKEQYGTFRHDQDRTFEHYGKRNKRSVWTTSVASYQGKHYATYPMKLIQPCIMGSTSERGCCPDCGSPWKRITEKIKIPADNRKGYEIQLVSKGWEPTCKCGNPNTKPCIVLDPFSGMATTGVVALNYYQYYFGIEPNPEYVKESRRRIKETDMFIKHVKDIGEF